MQCTGGEGEASGWVIWASYREINVCTNDNQGRSRTHPIIRLGLMGYLIL